MGRLDSWERTWVLHLSAHMVNFPQDPATGGSRARLELGPQVSSHRLCPLRTKCLGTSFFHGPSSLGPQVLLEPQQIFQPAQEEPGLPGCPKSTPCWGAWP